MDAVLDHRINNTVHKSLVQYRQFPHRGGPPRRGGLQRPAGRYATRDRLLAPPPPQRCVPNRSATPADRSWLMLLASLYHSYRARKQTPSFLPVHLYFLRAGGVRLRTLLSFCPCSYNRSEYKYCQPNSRR